MNTPPVLICGFNRPDCLRKVFAAVRNERPSDLFLVLDAPRHGRADDYEANDECKKIFEGVDWPCNVRRFYAETNMGCSKRIESGITEMFKEVEFGLIFEDDCIPCSDFFRFAAEMDIRYRNQHNIGMVASSAPSAADKGIPKDVSYYFDRFPYIWGWGTWRRAWNYYGCALPSKSPMSCAEVVGKVFKSYGQRRAMIRHFNRIYFDRAYTTEHGEWDSLWWFSCLCADLLCVHPTVNLISNVGYMGLHVQKRIEGVHDRAYGKLNTQIIHPKEITINLATERLLAQHYAPSLIKRIGCRIKRLVKWGRG